MVPEQEVVPSIGGLTLILCYFELYQYLGILGLNHVRLCLPKFFLFNSNYILVPMVDCSGATIKYYGTRKHHMLIIPKFGKRNQSAPAELDV